MSQKINRTVLISGADYFGVEELNPYSYKDIQPDITQAKVEHITIQQALESAGITIIKVDAPVNCQDGVYTANWALVRGNIALLSSLPNRRQAEQPYAENVLRNLGKKVVAAPYRFSGQGDCLACGDLLFCGSGYRTDVRMHQFVADTLGYEVVPLRTMPALASDGTPVINAVTGWPDSFFYDIDLALAVLTPYLIAWCPEAFDPESQERLRALGGVEKIEVSLEEAAQGFACNLVSTGDTVIMSAQAPELKAAIQAHGLTVITPEITELAKGGGYIRCTSLTLDNA